MESEGLMDNTYFMYSSDHGFVSILFSSFVGAALQRSLLCCGAGRKHFHAHSSPIGSDRDHAQQNSTVLRILM